MVALRVLPVLQSALTLQRLQLALQKLQVLLALQSTLALQVLQAMLQRLQALQAPLALQ